MKSLIQIPFQQHHKSWTPQLNVPRLQETYATNTLFASDTGYGGVSCAQIFAGSKSLYTKVFGMKTENEGPTALEDFVQGTGAPHTLWSDNAKMQCGNLWWKVLQKYTIKTKHTEPYYPKQNPAEPEKPVEKPSLTLITGKGSALYIG